PGWSRGWCAHFLTSEDSQKAAQRLMEIVSDPSEMSWVKACCVDALAKSDTTETSSFLSKLLVDPETDEWARIACAARFRDAHSTLVLITGLQNNNMPELARQRCATELGEIGGDLARQVLAGMVAEHMASDTVLSA